MGNRYYEAGTLTHLGDTQHAAGDTVGARLAWQDALDIFTDLDRPDAKDVQVKLDNLGGVPAHAG